MARTPSPEVIAVPTVVVPMDGSSFSERAPEVRDAAEARLASPVARFDGGRRVRGRALHGTPVSRALGAFAEDLPASLIAMAPHGRTGLARSALGSVAADITRIAPCPVLLLRSSLERALSARDHRRASTTAATPVATVDLVIEHANRRRSINVEVKGGRSQAQRSSGGTGS